jgi:hypothetical protein
MCDPTLVLNVAFVNVHVHVSFAVTMRLPNPGQQIGPGGHQI